MTNTFFWKSGSFFILVSYEYFLKTSLFVNASWPSKTPYDGKKIDTTPNNKDTGLIGVEVRHIVYTALHIKSASNWFFLLISLGKFWLLLRLASKIMWNDMYVTDQIFPLTVKFAIFLKKKSEKGLFRKTWKEEVFVFHFSLIY